MRIEVDDFSRIAVHELLNEHLANMYELSPPQQVFALDLSKLKSTSSGFQNAGPWAGYKEDPYSVIMELRLQRPA